MKKTIIALTATISVLTISVIGCKKEVRPSEDKPTETNEQAIQTKSPGQSGSFSGNISVSTYGFLIFPSTQDFHECREFITSKTHAEVQGYLNSIRFNSLGETLYGVEYWNQTITEEQATNYIFNEDKIFQINDVIMKPINETTSEVRWQFLLTMIPTNLSTSSYQNLATGIYDASTMNKFATNPVGETLDMFSFIRDTPSGYEESVANSSQARRPMFGSVTTTWVNSGQPQYNAGSGDCEVCSERLEQATTYIFFIGFPGEPEVVGSWCSPVPMSQCQ